MADVRTISAEIKRRVSAVAAGQKMGLNPDRQGYCRCPFHAEKTASLRLYQGERGWHCFGCGAGGTVIDLVMRYNGLKFWPAVIKLDSDFGLNLPLAEEKKRRRPTTIMAARREAFRRQRDDEFRRIDEEADRALLDAYSTVADLTAVLQQQMRDNRPTGPSEPFNAAFAEAANLLPFARDTAEALAAYAMGR